MTPIPAPGTSTTTRPSPLILGEQQVSRMQFLSRPLLRAGVAAVYVTADGRVEDLGRLLSRSEAVSGRFKTMYEVDVTRHECTVDTAHDPLPTRDDRFFFSARVDIGWWVSAPARVVEQGVNDGQSIVVRRVVDLMRKISRRYEITACDQAEEEINLLVSRAPIEIPEAGLSVYRISAHVTLDDAARDFLRRQTSIERDKELGRRSHERAREALTHEQELEQARMRAVADGVQGEFGLIARHLRHHPEEGLQVLHMLHARQQELERRQDARFANSTEMFTKMLDAGLIQNVDIEDIRSEVLRNTLHTVTGGQGAGATSAPPLPAGPPAGPPPVPTSAAGQPAPDPGRAVPGAAPEPVTPTANPGGSGVGGWRARPRRSSAPGPS